jgi:hypothetical protein
VDRQVQIVLDTAAKAIERRNGCGKSSMAASDRPTVAPE